MRKSKENTKIWLIISICFLLLLSSIYSYTQSNKQQKSDELSVTLTNVGFDTPITLSATCSQKEFSTYTKIVKKMFKENNKRFDQYHEYEGVNNVYTLNHEAYIHPVEVDDTLLDCLKLAMQMQNQNSQFNISQGKLLSLWHDAREETQIPPTDDEIHEAMQHSDINNIIINGNFISFTDSELSIDLGGIAKGYTAQLVKEKLNKAGLTNGYINAGGNVVLLGQKEDKTSWKIGIQSPNSSQALIQYETNKATCLVTSGDYQRYFTYKKKRYSHIIDPVTGYPAQYMHSVTVITKDSGIADALSTTLFCMSIEDGMAYIESLDFKVDAIWIVDKDTDYQASLETDTYKIITTDHIKNKVTLAS